jgi:hypothetical protein
MYANKLVASLKANGKILREFKDNVYIPFGSEYSFLLKNLNSKRALVNVFIDGEDMTPGGLVLNAGQEIDLERSIKNGNLREGNKFKFIERTGAVEKHRGVKLEDGLIRIEFQFELQHPMQSFFDDNMARYSKNLMRGISGGTGDVTYGVPQGTGSATYSSVSGSSMDSSWISASGATTNSMNISAQAQSMPANDVGITVAGSKSTQSFTTTTMGLMEIEKHSIIFMLLGETEDNKPVLQPVTVKTNQKCTTCNHTNKVSSKFCSECGTALTLYA